MTIITNNFLSIVMEKNKNKKNIIVVGTIVGFVIIILVDLGLYMYINHQLPFQSRTWDKKEIINLQLSEKPQNNIFSEMGCLSEDVECDEEAYGPGKETNTKVIVYVDQNTFVEEFGKYIDNSTFESSMENKEKIVEELKSLIVTSPEIELLVLNELINSYGDSNKIYLNDYVEGTFIKMIDEGKVAIFDIENNEFVTNYTYIDYGFYCGPLCGKGSTDYILPNGKIFRSIGWIS